MKRELDKAREEINKLRKKQNKDLVAENEQLVEKNEQFCEQNKKLAVESESFVSRVEFLQTELSQTQTFSRQEIEQLLNQMEMLQKDAELEWLHTVENERRKWKAKEDQLLQQLMKL